MLVCTRRWVTRAQLAPGPAAQRRVRSWDSPPTAHALPVEQVEVLEEADGWMLVRDPTGREGLVPTSYLNLDVLYQQASPRCMLRTPCPSLQVLGLDVAGKRRRFQLPAQKLLCSLPVGAAG